MTSVYAHHGVDEEEAASETEHESNPVTTVGWTEHHTCAVGGLVLAIALSGLLYPVLVALTESFGVLSTTALVATVIVVWSLGWIGLELLWEWRAGRWQAVRDR